MTAKRGKPDPGYVLIVVCILVAVTVALLFA
jgi:hypothetical protein